jgi:hypothetical protein
MEIKDANYEISRIFFIACHDLLRRTVMGDKLLLYDSDPILAPILDGRPAIVGSLTTEREIWAVFARFPLIDIGEIDSTERAPAVPMIACHEVLPGGHVRIGVVHGERESMLAAILGEE